MIFRRSILIYVCFVGTMLACAAQASGRGFSSDEWYVSWGYNRSAYTTSDVKMWGTGPSGEAFDVTLQDARANDMPERFQAKVYFHPGLFTIPQFNARFGKRIAPNWWVSAGWDHMKYKLQKQHVVADGYAGAADWENDDTLPPGTISEWSGDSLWWGEGFNLEHSDGMNFVRFSLEHQTDVWRSVNDQFMLSVFEAVGAGVVVCSTDFTWAGERQKKRAAFVRTWHRSACWTSNAIASAFFHSSYRPCGSGHTAVDSVTRANGRGSQAEFGIC